jgi:hypothetical protein
MVLGEQKVGVALVDLNELSDLIQAAVFPDEVGCKGVDVARNDGADPMHFLCDTYSSYSCSC